jgi:hypothetical protein
MPPEKTYADGIFLRAKETQYGELITASIDVQKFIAFANQHAKNGTLRLAFPRRREPSQTGVTHSAVLDTYEPKQRTGDMRPAGKPASAMPPASEGFKPGPNHYWSKPVEDSEIPF